MTSSKTDRPPDAAARCSWYVELHDTKELVHWERFKDGHVYYIPLGCMVPKDADNIVASGRCVDADSHALSAIRVMGPCIAMGTAAAHALDLAGKGSVHEDRPEEICSSDLRTISSALTSAESGQLLRESGDAHRHDVRGKRQQERHPRAHRLLLQRRRHREWHSGSC